MPLKLTNFLILNEGLVALEVPESATRSTRRTRSQESSRKANKSRQSSSFLSFIERSNLFHCILTVTKKAKYFEFLFYFVVVMKKKQSTSSEDRGGERGSEKKKERAYCLWTIFSRLIKWQVVSISCIILLMSLDHSDNTSSLDLFFSKETIPFGRSIFK